MNLTQPKTINNRLSMMRFTANFAVRSHTKHAKLEQLGIQISARKLSLWMKSDKLDRIDDRLSGLDFN